jgi:hypothetical protein
MRKPKGNNYEGAKPDWDFSVSEAGFTGEYAKGYADAMKSAAELVRIEGCVGCAETEDCYRSERDHRCKDCPQDLCEYIAGELKKKAL